MDVRSLKRYIFENGRIGDVLEGIGCRRVRRHEGGYYSAAQPDGDNPNGVIIRETPFLGYRSFSRGVGYGDGEDLISLVMKAGGASFPEAVRRVHGILGLECAWGGGGPRAPAPEEDPLKVFTDAEDMRAGGRPDPKPLGGGAMDGCVPMLHIDWVREGIMPWTRKRFGIAYSYGRRRVMVPLRYWLTGELLGVSARTTAEDYDMLGIRKYLVSPGYPKWANVYGLWENCESIREAGYAVVYEAEKSVLKRDSLNDRTGVALSGHCMSDEQAGILTGLGVDIIIAMDGDVPLAEVRHMCEKVGSARTVYYMRDRWGVAGAKDSPADAGAEGFGFLMEHKVRYGAEERREYLKEAGPRAARG